MDLQKIAEYAEIKQPAAETWTFTEELKKLEKYYFKETQGCDPGENFNCLQNGVEIIDKMPAKWQNISSAVKALERLLDAKNVEQKKAAWPIILSENKTLAEEAFRLKIDKAAAKLEAADQEGMRRGLYFLQDKISAAQAASIMPGEWQRKPFVKHRISRCFYGPTYRAPFFIDELTNDIDYYPEAYLNKLASEGINGLWLTMYFHDLPSSIFKGRGENAEKRFAKLRQTVAKCAQYGIKIYVFFSEPKLFGNASYTVPLQDAEACPEIIGGQHEDWSFFCTSTEIGLKYLEESVNTLFTAVPGLGGMINIMYGEDNGACVAHQLGKMKICHCQRCLTRKPEEIYREMAQTMYRAMRQVSIDAEFIGWFYAPGIRDGNQLSKELQEAVSLWPEECGLMVNFESGAYVEQEGKKRIVFDYSLAFPGPSEFFADVMKETKKPAAKLQVGCSHENASVPFIPVPDNLYIKYQAMQELSVYAVMQCWYFGNYPGLMNKAAGLLSFKPEKQYLDDFLMELAQPDWREHSQAMLNAWKLFGESYRLFPANIAFAWFGPLHHSIAWPWHLNPVDLPIAPSWILENFPKVSGDRIGECLCYHHTLAEALAICQKMTDKWEEGCKIIRPLRKEFDENPPRLADLDLTEAILLQIKSSRNLLQFYSWREEMFHKKVNNLPKMETLVREEIENTSEMLQLCLRDSRLGYHSEAEGYLFFPEKLRARKKLLEDLLTVDFPEFDINSEMIEHYTGRKGSGKIAYCAKNEAAAEKYYLVNKDSAYFTLQRKENILQISFYGLLGSSFCFELEPCRLWTPLRADFTEKGEMTCYGGIFRELPEVRSVLNGDKIELFINLDVFEGFYEAESPMRFNIRGTDFCWIEGEDYPSRLLHRDFNPARAGLLYL